MNDNRAGDWLSLGVAAAQDGRKEDARFFLERALISDADLDQKVQAWYWLSRATDDPVRKREYLENVLVSFPGHVEARRDLAILEGRLKPEDVVDHRRPVQPVAPGTVEVRRYVCPQCGGKLAFDAAQGALTCGYCGRRATEDTASVLGNGVQEQDFLAALPTARAHRWELPAARLLTCQGCGASFTLPPAQATAPCPFCASAHVVESAGGDEFIQPEGVLPFQFTAEAARQHLRQWLADQRACPSDLARQAVIASLRPVYLPFWTFNVVGEVRWQGQIVDEWQSEPVTISGSQPVWYDNLLIPASHSLPLALLSPLQDFDLHALAPYSGDLLADWPVEIYQIPLANASLVAHQRAFQAATAAIRSSFSPGQSVNGLFFDSAGITVESFKLVLLPVWVAAYRYGQKDYAAIVNGQTGQAHGQVPRSGWQRFLAGLVG